MEKTRGELAVAHGGKRLEERMSKITDMLDELEGTKDTKDRKGVKKKRKAAKKGVGPEEADDDADLDIDSVWKE